MDPALAPTRFAGYRFVLLTLPEPELTERGRPLAVKIPWRHDEVLIAL